MDGSFAASAFGVPLEILFLDLLLSGDNAVVIALACRRLPPRDAQKAILLGTAGAISLRLVLTAFASVLISLPFIKFVSAVPLLLIAINVIADKDEALETSDVSGAKDGLLAAAGVIIASDAIMSVDNVVALAAVSQGNFWYLIAGLALSIPLLIYGSALLTTLIRHAPALVLFGGALLGWIAGDMIASDPLIAGWVNQQAPALAMALPAAGAVFVAFQGLQERRRRDAAPAPERRAQPRPPQRAAAPKAPPKPTPQPKPKPLPTVKSQTPVLASPMEPDAASASDELTSASDFVMLIGVIGLFIFFGLFSLT